MAVHPRRRGLLFPRSLDEAIAIIKRNGTDVSDRSAKRLRWQIPIFLAICALSYLRTTFILSESNSRSGVVPPEFHINVSQNAARRLHEPLKNVSNPDNCIGLCMSKFEKERQDKIDSEFVLINARSMLKYRDECLSKENEGKQEALESSTALAVVKDEKMAWIVWYIFGIVYMFAGLAVVCDEFFVPALECFVDEFGISMDVAGATFMAAGGSMPELFTSFIATFQESEIGFVAIVGSAVFNVLFVIAVCAIASPEVLPLTWWPLARDCSFYITALLTVAFVFTVNTRNRIDAWEACLLLLEYVGYCTFMKFNGRVNAFIEDRIASKVRSSMNGETPTPTDTDADQGTVTESRLSETHGRRNSNPHFGSPSTFRKGIVQMLTKNTYLYETAGILAVTQVEGDVDDTFDKLDVDGDNKLSAEEIRKLLASFGINNDIATIKTQMRRINKTGEEMISRERFKSWYLTSEQRIEADINRVFDTFDKGETGFIDASEIESCLKGLGHTFTANELIQIIDELARFVKEHPVEGGGDQRMDDGDPPPAPPVVTPVEHFGDEQRTTSIEGFKLSLEQFQGWYTRSLFYNKKKEQHKHEAEEAENSHLTLDMPEKDAGYFALFWYVFTYPLCACLYCTLPDVRHPKWRRNYRMAILEFCLCLVWIALMSNWLYECLVVVSNTLQIPVAVSAVTLLAGGTSVPDLLSSYVVAKNKEGDMAVSSSIGSNIFDVTVGLPLPWLMYNIIKGKSFNLGDDGSKGIGFNILLLVGMLGAVIGTLICTKWRMTKAMGYMMMVFYGIYVLQYLLVKLPDHCPPKDDGLYQIDF